ncbi:hydrogenase expression/formation protein HypE [Eubacterium coprostanoligenes]|uniref:hydrogenase expression/formation protein HypE n=1 Tax=Eubacterium coprostanoligenes TaxID=290054 RepID=UPI002354343A|nr:hydrogenase expression/formation protein HypE [Eubacterium coprostanoligenes]MCI6254529.1 hydrogenase expression/formation protein HypE [Eubacterium coprostanoligenes]MDY5399769.1 hydrogenase expression/formation protein HypE [Eubacterium coprostanoligenes]
MKITLSHGSGGKATSELIDQIFARHFSNPILNMMEDSAVVDGYGKIAITTDSFVVTPLFFKGGDIGRLAVCGTVNDLLMRGAVAKYITSAFIIEEDADTDTLEAIASSMAKTANEAGVCIVAGDTKVIEGNGGVYINTTGIGFANNENIVSTNLQDGDCVIVSGTMGDHHATILSARMEIENDIQSDNAPLTDIVKNLIDGGIDIHCMRDVTRGGLGTVLNELANASQKQIEIEETAIPITDEVRAFSKILGLNIMHMGNEGKLVAIIPSEQANKAVEIMKNSKYGENATIIGKVTSGEGVILNTRLGGQRKINVLIGEGLPRIC